MSRDRAVLRLADAAPSSPAPSPPPPPSPLLVTARQAAQLCGVSVATWWRWEAAGRTPAAVRLGGSTRWRSDELADWVQAGCPDRRSWLARQAGRK
jgi:predicted DNA-binding transcriptional regulator AlpA